MQGSDPGGRADSTPDELAAVERAMTALEGQRAALGDEVVETALAPLRERRAALQAPRAEQRRLVTVVFSDLVDFTVLSRRLDAEDTREVVNAYFALWQQVIEAQGGVVEKFIGDAVMAVFGLRTSYEDDAQRAVRAALAMRDGLPGLSARISREYGVELHMRVGVDTGEVVVSTLGERAGHDFVAVGPTVNRASRLQSAAPVDQVLISTETHRQVRGWFSFEESAALTLKGIDEPVEAFVVRRERPQGFHLDRAGGIEGVEAPTVGRDIQLRFLQERLWDVEEDRQWRVVTIVGDAGLGKSRLLRDFDAWLAERPDAVWWFRGRAHQSGRNRALGLLRDVLKARLGLQETDTTPEVREKFAAGFETAFGPGEGRQAAQLVGTWLGFDLDDGSEELPSDPQNVRDRGTELLARYFAALGRTAPVVILLEDLHWADDGSLRWLDAADPLLHGTQVLVVATTRPTLLEERPHWGEGLAHHVRLPLPALSRRETRELARRLLQHVEDLPATLSELVVDAADGNPFYVEELVTWLLDAGVVVRDEPHWFVVDELVHSVVVPSTLKGVLQSRLDALGSEERDLLQRASVVGRVFWDDAVARLDEAHEPSALVLDTLRRREIVYQREVSAFESAHEYLFKHALLRDVAYDSVLRAHRERYHHHAATWLAEVSAAAGRQEEYAAIIAEHFEKARDPEAARWYLVAGRNAASVFALEEATRLFEQALDLADGPVLRFDVRLERERLFDWIGDRALQEAELQAMAALEDDLDEERGIALRVAQSAWAFQHSDYTRAVALASQASQRASELGRDQLVAWSELWLGKACTWSDDADGAARALERARALSERTGQQSLTAEAVRYLGMLANNAGRYDDAVRLGQEAVAAFARGGNPDGEATAIAQLATAYFNMNHLDEARAALERTLPIFRRSGHRYRESVALGNLASVGLLQGRLAEAERWAQKSVLVSVDLDDREGQATNLTVLGMIESITGRFVQATGHFEQALALARDVGSLTHEADVLQRLVIAELDRGEVDAALDHAREATEVSARTLSSLESAQARFAVGYAAGAAELWQEARAAFVSAAELTQVLDLPALVREARAGLAGVERGEGNLAEAVALVRELVAHLDVKGLEGTVSGARVLLTSWQVLDEAGDPGATDVLCRAHAYLRERAALVGDDELAAMYLQVPLHAQLLALS